MRRRPYSKPGSFRESLIAAAASSRSDGGRSAASRMGRVHSIWAPTGAEPAAARSDWSLRVSPHDAGDGGWWSRGRKLDDIAVRYECPRRVGPRSRSARWTPGSQASPRSAIGLIHNSPTQEFQSRTRWHLVRSPFPIEDGPRRPGWKITFAGRRRFTRCRSSRFQLCCSELEVVVIPLWLTPLRRLAAPLRVDHRLVRGRHLRLMKRFGWCPRCPCQCAIAPSSWRPSARADRAEYGINSSPLRTWCPYHGESYPGRPLNVLMIRRLTQAGFTPKRPRGRRPRPTRRATAKATTS